MLLAEYQVLMVGVVCPLEELERRERQRDAGRQGFARSQFDMVHKDRMYDITVYTDLEEPEACARKILNFYSNGSPSVMAKLADAAFPSAHC